MIEARIKELALKLWQHPRVAFQLDNRDAVLEIITEHFRIIAAESREDGWKEGAKKMRERAYSKLLSLSFSSGYLDPSRDCVDMAHLLRDAHKEIEAERLKEGKP